MPLPNIEPTPATISRTISGYTVSEWEEGHREYIDTKQGFGLPAKCPSWDALRKVSPYLTGMHIHVRFCKDHPKPVDYHYVYGVFNKCHPLLNVASR